MDEIIMEEFGTPYSSEKTIDILGDRWWPQAATREGENIRETFPCNIPGMGTA